MDKTISISLGGFSFTVDETAYNKLKKYLGDVRSSLRGMEGTEDVISDVEIRIAELFKERLGGREVVSESDVEHIIEVMGKPEQYVDEEDSVEYSSANRGNKKKLYRDTDSRVLGGVLSGIAHYIGVESWITRVAWLLMFFADIPLTGTTFTIIAYVLLWIILPKAETATQKYEMYGEAGDIESIRKSSAEGGRRKGDSSDGFGEVLRVIGKIFLVFIGFILICIGLSLAFGAVMTLVASVGGFPVQFFGRVFDYQWQDITAKAILLILLGVPGLLITLFGAKLIFNRVKINRMAVIIPLVLWLASIVGSVLLTATAVKGFSKKVEFVDKKAYTTENDTLVISFNENKNIGKRNMIWNLEDELGGFTEFDGKYYKNIDKIVEIRQSPNNRLFVDAVYSSKGSNMDAARSNAEKITYNYSMNSKGELVFDNFFEVPKDSKYRDQNVSLVVYVPEGKTIHSKNLKYLNFTEEDSFGKNYQPGNNKFYKFVDEQYVCANCKNNSVSNDSDESSIKINNSSDSIVIQDGDNKIEINNNEIKITDGTDTINIGGTGN